MSILNEVSTCKQTRVYVLQKNRCEDIDVPLDRQIDTNGQ